MTTIGKRTKAAREGIERVKLYPLEEAVKMVKARATAKFDETIEIAMNLGVDPRHADQMVRGVVQLPSGSGRKVRVAVFARGDKANEAKAAGADVVGAEDLVTTVQGGKVDFDRAIATPDMMPLVGRLGKVLGPRGLMPNPKVGTVTADVAGIPRGKGRNHSGGRGQGELRRAGAARQHPGLCRRGAEGEARRSEGYVCAAGGDLIHHGARGPGRPGEPWRRRLGRRWIGPARISAKSMDLPPWQGGNESLSKRLRACRPVNAGALSCVPVIDKAGALLASPPGFPKSAKGLFRRIGQRVPGDIGRPGTCPRLQAPVSRLNRPPPA